MLLGINSIHKKCNVILLSSRLLFSCVQLNLQALWINKCPLIKNKVIDHACMERKFYAITCDQEDQVLLLWHELLCRWQQSDNSQTRSARGDADLSHRTCAVLMFGCLHLQEIQLSQLCLMRKQGWWELGTKISIWATEHLHTPPLTQWQSIDNKSR